MGRARTHHASTGMPGRRAVRRVPGILLAVLLCTGTVSASEPPSGADVPNCVIHAAFDPDEAQLSGTAVWVFRNPCPRPLERIYLDLYPNRLIQPNPALNDVNYGWSYPRTFQPGSMVIERVTVTSKGIRPLLSDFQDIGGRPEKTLLRIDIAPPLPPGQTLRLEAEFTTTVPRKYGTFGHYLGGFTLNGGWYPNLPLLTPDGWVFDAPPAEARFDVKLDRPASWKAVCNGTFFDAGVALAREGAFRFVSLSLSEEMHRYAGETAGASVTYYRFEESGGSGRRVCDTACQVFQFLHDMDVDVAGRRVVLVEGHFRTVLTAHGEGCSLVSDRILRVLPYPIDLRKYHLREIAAEVLYQVLVDHCRRVEHPKDWNWVAEGLAWSWLRDFLQWRDTGFAEVTDIMSTFSFIPVIDQTLVAPRFPFNDVFFDTFFKAEPQREGVLRWNNATPFGRLVIEKLKDAATPAAVRKAREDQRLKGKALIALVEKASGEDLSWFAPQWRKGYPLMNYRVGEIDTEDLGEGRVRISTEIFRRGGRGFKEIVELGVRCADGRKYIGELTVERERTLDTFIYPDGWDKVIIDPRVRVHETNKTDNHRPRKPKLLVTAFNPRLEYETAATLRDSKLNLELYGGFAGIFEGDYANQILLNYFYTKRGFGADLGYWRGFDAKLDRTDFRQGVGGFFYLEQLQKSFAIADYHGDDDTEDLTVASFLLSYTLDTRIDFSNPHKGVRVRLALEVAEKVFGTDFKFRRFLWDLRWITAPQREHVLAFHAHGGLSWGDVPAQRRFSAGGYYGVRGIPENQALGSQSIILRWEYRHMLWHDLNLNFFFFGWVRKVQGVLFLETGATASRAVDLARADAFRSGLGYGVRIEFDSFGVRPFLIGVDMGYRLDQSGPQPVFYMTATQSF